MVDVDIEKVLMSNKTSFGEKSYKYFIGYLYYGNEVKPLIVMLPKTRLISKVMIGKLNRCIF